MGSFKVRVNSEAESKEAQELFQKLVGKENGFITMDKSIRWVALYQGQVVQYEFLPCVELNEITLPELRDMVVLKRNDKSDRNVADLEYPHVNLYLDSNNNLFVFHIPTQKWIVSKLNCVRKVLARLKPIEKTISTLNTEQHEQPPLNDQHAEIEQVRQAIKVQDGNDSDHALDAMSFGIMANGATSGGAKDNVSNPSHYTKGKVECIDALESATIGKSGIEAVCVANVIKYLWRYEEKNGLEDVKKAQWYLERLIASMDS